MNDEILTNISKYSSFEIINFRAKLLEVPEFCDYVKLLQFGTEDFLNCVIGQTVRVEDK